MQWILPLCQVTLLHAPRVLHFSAFHSQMNTSGFQMHFLGISVYEGLDVVGDIVAI